MKRDIFGTPTILKRFTIGRDVWVRCGSRWTRAQVYTVSNGSLILREYNGHDIHVHYSVLHRDVRVSDPAKGGR